MSAHKILDANEAVAQVAYRLSEVVCIYPITPSSPMGEWADTWSAARQSNLWGALPEVVEMQSEGGAAGALHGALQTGALATTFTASQGLLLMLPNLFKIAGELTPAVIHVAARSVATHALSIFGDHSDVMAMRPSGWAMLASGSVQEAIDQAAIAHAVTLETRVPMLHFFDGFRTSHELNSVEPLSDEVLRALVADTRVLEHRARALSPEHPVLRGTAQNPDVFFQGREASNRFHQQVPEQVQQAMDRFAELAGRRYQVFEYDGHPEAQRVLVVMGSGAETARETVRHLEASGERVGVVTVRLYRPFDIPRFLNALPSTVKKLGVLDRTKESGALGEPLFLDVSASVQEGKRQGQIAADVQVIGGRYGLSSKEFTPAMVKASLDHLQEDLPRHPFTVGIVDDVTGLSLSVEEDFRIETDETFRAVFFGLGSDGTVGANKNSIKIIGDLEGHYAQAYFVYDSKKSGAMTVSHLRFGPQPIRAPYLIERAHFIACHQSVFLERHNVLSTALPESTFLLNTPDAPDQAWRHLPRPLQEQLIAQRMRFFVIDAEQIARSVGMGRRINTVMQAAFFKVSGVLPESEAVAAIREAVKKTYAAKGEAVVEQNLAALDAAMRAVYEVPVPEQAESRLDFKPPVPEGAPEFVQDVLGGIIADAGNALPVSALPVDGTFPTATARWEKRNLASEVPVWDPKVCIQCNKCVMVCPHSVIRAKVVAPEALSEAPEGFPSVPARDRSWDGGQYVLSVAPEDCTGCGICVQVCPAKNKSQARLKAINMEPQPPLREPLAAQWNFFLELPETDRLRIDSDKIPQQQLQQPLFEFSGACSGCGETPYVKLVSQLFGDRMVVANATGCSSIYGGNLPTTPWSVNAEGRGPAWSNSLFEDNAEFGLGFRVTLDQQRETATRLLKHLGGRVGDELVEGLLSADQSSEAGIQEQRERVEVLHRKLAVLEVPEARQLASLAEVLVRRSVWIIGGDGWAYDIGFGGLDHVLASGRDVNLLVLDTEVYSNTGGQKSKSTPMGAVAKFAMGGKAQAKKDLGLMAMSYGTVYVASVAMGAKDTHTLRAFLEAESYHGPSLIIAYSHCIAHGIDMTMGMQHQKALVQSGSWPLYRFDPRRIPQHLSPLQLDSKPSGVHLAQFQEMENRYRMLRQADPETAKHFLQAAEVGLNERQRFYEHLAGWIPEPEPDPSPNPSDSQE
ncbi:MAG: pyruvate:ferredoxin (flavodoxin) oxidoreductase [bacterium]